MLLGMTFFLLALGTPESQVSAALEDWHSARVRR
jgi:hypothetical protein